MLVLVLVLASVLVLVLALALVLVLVLILVSSVVVLAVVVGGVSCPALTNSFSVKKGYVGFRAKHIEHSSPILLTPKVCIVCRTLKPGNLPTKNRTDTVLEPVNIFSVRLFPQGTYHYLPLGYIIQILKFLS